MSNSVLRVLTYHRVMEPLEAQTVDRSLLSATPAVFDKQMRYLAKHYYAVSAEEALDAVRENRSLPERAVLVTFDDAYWDVGRIAWPILQQYGIPATVFVPTAYPDHPEREFWWDRLYRAFASSPQAALDLAPLGSLPLHTHEARRTSLRAVQNHLKTIPHTVAMPLVDWICGELGDQSPVPNSNSTLCWSELRALAREGMTLGVHTQTHPALDQLPLDQVRAELQGAREDLQREIGSVLPICAYPFGAYNDQVVEVAREEGFEMALTCLDGHNQLSSTDPLQLCRTNITLRTSPLIFRMRLLRVFSYVDRWRHRGHPA